MGMKLPIAATTIACSACIAGSVVVPTVDLPEKAVQDEAVRSVTQEYSLAAVTLTNPFTPITQVIGFVVTNGINPIGTLAAIPINVPLQTVQGVPFETIIANNFTAPIDKLENFPAGFAALIQSILNGNTSMAATDTATVKTAEISGPSAALDVAELTNPFTPITQVIGFVVTNGINPIGTLAAIPINVPLQTIQGVPFETIIANNFTAPIDKLENFPAGFAALIQSILNGNTSMAATDTATVKTSQPLQNGNQVTSNATTKPADTLQGFPAKLADAVQAQIGLDRGVIQDILGGKGDLTPESTKKADPSITTAPGFVNSAITNIDLRKTDPTLGSKSSITDVPGSVAGASAAQRRLAPRLLSLRPNSTDPTTGTNSDVPKALSNFTGSLGLAPHSRKDGNTGSTTAGSTAGTNAGSNPSPSGG